ncbi:MAG TPA: glucose-1-phosphate adenylyltransferase subunit GlgD, partial [Candidatus Choladocola avistercoris]|nr:glucose-1-phosphate adenylyltransferase subunit GlgD [Candidatus Choladocola avistercoris]
NCILLTNVVIGEGVHIEGQVVDKNARVTKMKEIIADPETPGYIRRNDMV